MAFTFDTLLAHLPNDDEFQAYKDDVTAQGFAPVFGLDINELASNELPSCQTALFNLSPRQLSAIIPGGYEFAATYVPDTQDEYDPAERSLLVAQMLAKTEAAQAELIQNDMALARKLAVAGAGAWQDCDLVKPLTLLPVEMGHNTGQPADLIPGNASTGCSAQKQSTDKCQRCLEHFHAHLLVCADTKDDEVAEDACTDSASAGCGHYFCAGCMSEYVRGAVRERKYPVLCPMASGGGAQGGCRHRLSREAVLAALNTFPEEMPAYRLLEAQSALDPRKVVYCPHKACSSPLELPDDLPPDQPTTCPACGKGFCPRCRIPGWHQGYTCAAFQQLPLHLRSAEDAAVLQLSDRQQWKRCPQCGTMVERTVGCNHMSCRCGAAFCYACGKEYRSKQPSATNAHGTPACECQLFDVPEEEGDVGPQPVMQLPLPLPEYA